MKLLVIQLIAELLLKIICNYMSGVCVNKHLCCQEEQEMYELVENYGELIVGFLFINLMIGVFMNILVNLTCY